MSNKLNRRESFLHWHHQVTQKCTQNSTVACKTIFLNVILFIKQWNSLISKHHNFLFLSRRSKIYNTNSSYLNWSSVIVNKMLKFLPWSEVIIMMHQSSSCTCLKFEQQSTSTAETSILDNLDSPSSIIHLPITRSHWDEGILGCIFCQKAFDRPEHDLFLQN